MLTKRQGAITEIKVFEMNAKKNKSVYVNSRNFYSLSYRFSGKVSIVTNGNELISEAESVTFMPKGVDYSTEILEDTYAIAIHFSFDSDINFRHPYILTPPSKKERELFKALYKKFKYDDPFDVHFMADLYELFADLDNMKTNDDQAHIPQKIRAARECISKEFCYPLFSVSTLAERLGISASYLRREFSKYYSESPLSYLKAMRLYNAKNLLDSEYLSIEEIAEQCGFTSASYFIQFFGKAVGISPNKYRKQLTEKTENSLNH